jgi:hypothetical protein
MEFKALIEEICAAQNATRFNLLLERLRDDLVEAWNQVGGYEESPALSIAMNSESLALKDKIREHMANVSRPDWCATVGQLQLTANVSMSLKIWRGRRDSNSRPLP